MNLEVLMSCMHQTDDALVKRTKITGDIVVINQCDWDDYKEYPTIDGLARIYSTKDRGLTKSRNMAIEKSKADVCLLCDDDEIMEDDYESTILDAYKSLPQADVIIFNMKNRAATLGDEIRELRFPHTAKVSSWQISFKKQSLLKSGIRFDELMGAGTGNGAEEELKFLTDCQKAGLKIFYVPQVIASVGQEQSTWFAGFTEEFFVNRGATTRYILGTVMASLYAVYYIATKKSMYQKDISSWKALKAIFRGIKENKISKLAKKGKNYE